MNAIEVPFVRDLVLIGGGHSHVHVLKMFGMKPVDGVRVTVISRDVLTPYSGMLPGLISGSYTFDEAHIDLNKLANFSNSRLIHGEVIGIDTAAKLIHLKDISRPPIRYDVLSLDIGSTPTTSTSILNVTPVKPIDSFALRWNLLKDRMVECWQRENVKKSFNIVCVGGGAGSVEIILSIHNSLTKELQKFNHLLGSASNTRSLLQFTLVSRSKRILSSHKSKVSSIFMRILKEKGIKVHLNCAVISSNGKYLSTSTGIDISYDECLWCTQASAQNWLRNTGLELDEKNFIKVDSTLESINMKNIFAAGDVACMIEHPRPKAGVFAVRAGPPLATNLRRRLLGMDKSKFKKFTPQKSFLGIISTGSCDNAVASRGWFVMEGKWLWKLKDRIDRKWMRKYKDLPQMISTTTLPPIAKNLAAEGLSVLQSMSMRCCGCGAKVGSSILDRVMAKLRLLQSTTSINDIVVAGLDSPDDCALVKPLPPGSLGVHTIDYFPSFISDPYIFGQIAANHALSDIFAMCAEPQSALAIAMVPHGNSSIMEDSLLQMMAGAMKVLNEARCSLVGGHTCEADGLGLGFAVNGCVRPEAVIRKGGMRIGDCLIITKAIGTGTILAADMRMMTSIKSKDAAVVSMLQSNQLAANILKKGGATSMTDITGFGLLGHLAEMTQASLVTVELHLDSIPVLDGALSCILKYPSTLQKSNERYSASLENSSIQDDPKFHLLFDPQTSGGLIASVPESAVEDILNELKQSGYEKATVIGKATGIVASKNVATINVKSW